LTLKIAANLTKICLKIDSPKVKDTGIIILEAVVLVYHPVEQILVLRQIGSGRQKPAVAEASLLHVKPAEALDKKLRVAANFVWSEPLVASFGGVREKKTLVGCRKLAVLKELSRVEALLADGVKVLRGLWPANGRLSSSVLKWVVDMMMS
jgi:hypothetical protein